MAHTTPQPCGEIASLRVSFSKQLDRNIAYLNRNKNKHVSLSLRLHIFLQDGTFLEGYKWVETDLLGQTVEGELMQACHLHFFFFNNRA